MDVIEFFSEFRRMCKSTSDCTNCEYHGDRCDNAIEILEKTVAMVEQWSRENPRKTRQSVFLEQNPEAEIDEDGILLICPKFISDDYRRRYDNCEGMVCTDCRMEFWGQKED